jgi:hypothetical protein
VRIAEYAPLLSPEPEVNDPNPIENLGSTPFRADATARLSAAKYIRMFSTLIFELHLSGIV